MKTIQSPRATVMPGLSPVPTIGAVALRRFTQYLAERDGIDHHEFTTREHLPDVETARSFAEELRRQLGTFLSTIISVEQRNNRVLVVLRDGGK